MPVFERFGLSGHRHAKNFTAILEMYYGGTDVKILEHFLNREGDVRALILRGNVLEIVTFTPLQRIDNTTYPIDLHIETIPLNNIQRIKEDFLQHRLSKNAYYEVKTTFILNNGEEITIDDDFAYYDPNQFEEFKEDYEEFMNELKSKL